METSTQETSPWIAVLLWSFLGLVGGLVHNCEELKPYSGKRMFASLLTSAFAGAAGAALATGYIESPTVLGGISAMFGYFGQLSLILIIKIAKKKLGIKD